MERMKVSLALLLFSPEMTAALQTCQAYDVYGFQSIQPTIDFSKKFWRWWEMHDITNRTQYVQQRKEDKMPFYCEDDPRLDWLKVDFLNWLDDWRAESQAILEKEEKERRVNAANEKEEAKTRKASEVAVQKEDEENVKSKKPQKRKIFLTNETYKAIKLTTNSTVDCIRYLLKESKILDVLTSKMTTDDIERTHGALRHYCGHNDHPTAAAALAAAEKMARTALARCSMNCNVPLKTQRGAAKIGVVDQLMRQRPKERERAHSVLTNLPPELSKILQELVYPR
jgi:hypothetical protein